MTTLTVTAKGQITLKKELLQHLGAKPGDKLDVVAQSGGRLQLVPMHEQHDGGLDAFFGSLANEHDVHFTIGELNEEIEKAWAGQR